MARKLISMVLAIVIFMGLSQTMGWTVEAANSNSPDITFSNMSTYWDNTWGQYEFVFEFHFTSSESIYEVGLELRESDGFLKYERNTAFSCQPFNPESVQLAAGSNVVESFVPGETYNWIAYVVCDGQRYDSQVSYFTFSDKPSDDSNTETDNMPTLIISSHPSDIIVEQGKSTSLSVYVISSNGRLSYQWYSNDTESTTGATKIVDATSRSYSPHTDEIGIMYYYCVVTNTGVGEIISDTSSVAQVKVKSSETKPVEPDKAKTFYKDENNNRKFISTYPLDWFITNKSKSSTTYDPEMADLAMTLACSAYDEICIRDSLISHGFTATDQTMLINNYIDKFNYLKPAYAIGKKTAENGEIVIAITIRGSESLADWLTDLGFLPSLEDGHHPGFDLATESAFLELNSFLGGIPKNGKTKFFITGHSYGGAVANLLAVKLLDIGVPKNSVYTYTFASPNVAAKTALGNWNKNGKYDGVFNVCNKMDPVTYAPPSAFPMKWDKYGKSLWFDNYETFSLHLDQHSRYKYIDYLEHHVIPKSYPLGDINGFLAEIFCPVDVEVLDHNGNVVAQIIDGRSEYLDDVFGNVILSTDGDKKYVFLTEDAGYTINMIGTNKGEMTYAVSEYEILGGERATKKTFENVPLEKGKKMTSNIGDAIDSPDVRLYVTDRNGKIIDEIIGEVISQFPFTDVKVSDWFYKDVKIAYESDLINGTSTTTFSPNNNLSYAEAVKLATCMHQKYTTGSVRLINGNPWYQSYVDYAKTYGIINKDYDWNSSATRSGYMEIFANALPESALSEINTVENGTIPDMPMTNPYTTVVYKLYRAGIVQGVDTAHNCNPSSNIRRSEVAAILTRMMNSSARIKFQLLSDEKPSQSYIPSHENFGNTHGNILNGGYAAIKDNQIYFCNGSKLYTMTADGGNKQELTDNPAYDINVVDDRIYYHSIDGIISIKIDGSDKQRLCDYNVSKMRVVGNRIYYLNHDDGNKIYSMKTDGSDIYKLNDDDSWSINVVGNRIYYLNSNDGGKMYSIGTDGSDHQMLLSIPSYVIIVDNDQIYYRNYWDNDKIYSMKIDGSSAQKVGDDSSNSINVVGDWIYYRNVSDNEKLYRIKTDGSDRQKLNDDKSQSINVVGDWIFYRNFSDNQKLYVMKIDGSNRECMN